MRRRAAHSTCMLCSCTPGCIAPQSCVMLPTVIEDVSPSIATLATTSEHATCARCAVDEQQQQCASVGLLEHTSDAPAGVCCLPWSRKRAVVCIQLAAVALAGLLHPVGGWGGRHKAGGLNHGSGECPGVVVQFCGTTVWHSGKQKCKRVDGVASGLHVCWLVPHMAPRVQCCGGVVCFGRARGVVDCTVTQVCKPSVPRAFCTLATLCWATKQRRHCCVAMHCNWWTQTGVPGGLCLP